LPKQYYFSEITSEKESKQSSSSDYRKGVLDLAVWYDASLTVDRGSIAAQRTQAGRARISFRFLAQPVADNAGVEIGEPEIGEPQHDGTTADPRGPPHIKDEDA